MTLHNMLLIVGLFLAHGGIILTAMWRFSNNVNERLVRLETKVEPVVGNGLKKEVADLKSALHEHLAEVRDAVPAFKELEREFNRHIAEENARRGVAT